MAVPFLSRVRARSIFALLLAFAPGCGGSSDGPSGGPSCGDGVIAPEEECDPAANLTETCEDRGFSGGPLVCDATTCTVDDGFCYDCGANALSCPDAWLGAHNAVRTEINAGTWAAEPAPSSPMPLLAWNNALSAVAASHAAECVWEHNAQRTEDYAALGGSGYVGENMSLGLGLPTPEGVVTGWAGEAVDYDYASNTCAAGEMCGHYTQVAWASTTAVGCAAYQCPTIEVDGDLWEDAWLVVCDYAPGGNYVGERPY